MAIVKMEIDGSLAPPASLGRALNLTSGAVNRLAQALLAEHGLQLAQWVVLSALWRRDGLTTGELARYTGNALPATSRIIDRMAQSGLVSRRGDPADRRTVRVHVTAKGRTHAHLGDFHERLNAMLLGGLGEAERTALFAMLAQVEANARTALDDASATLNP